MSFRELIVELMQCAAIFYLNSAVTRLSEAIERRKK